jgi:hypothetical protein
MSNTLQFNLNLVSSVNDPRVNREDDLKSSPVTYLVSPNEDQVMLCTNERYPIATFEITDLPPFLQRVNGLYLGDIYMPMIKVNERQYYLSKTERSNIYQLLTPEEVQFPEDLFSLSLFGPELQWGEEDSIKNIFFENFEPEQIVDGEIVGFFLNSSVGMIPDQQLIYSPTACFDDCLTCGNVCPDDYFCLDGICMTNLDGTGFGLRGNGVVYTYKISPNGKTATVAATDKSMISADLERSGDIETNGIVRERYFFADYDVEEEGFLVNKEYPIYIWDNGQKKYLSNPNRLTENGPTVYQLTYESQPDTAVFSPMTTANWRELTLTPGDFVNFAFNNTPRLSLWNNPSFEGVPAVTESVETFTQPPTEAPFATPVTTPFQNNRTPPVATTEEPVRENIPFWKQWWFWLIIALLLILLIVFIIVLTRRSSSPPPKIGQEYQFAKPAPPYNERLNLV